MSTTLGKVIPTNDGSFTICHPEHGECYHSIAGARSEASNLYLSGSHIQELLKTTSQTVRVLDIGLGLAYNCLTTIEAWFETKYIKADLEIVSLENNADLVKLLTKTQGDWQRQWPENWLAWASALTQTKTNCFQAQICHPINPKYICHWTVALGNALELDLKNLFGGHLCQFFWQDPFSPKINPNLWTPRWFQKLHEAANDTAVLMTYSVARIVKDALQEAGWKWQIIPTPENSRVKKHWLRAIA